MLNYPSNIDPVAFVIGPIVIRWYGLCYLVSFLLGHWLLRRRSRELGQPVLVYGINDLVFYTALGVIFGGRIGYMFFYQIDILLANPWLAIAFWLPGRSFHGGLVGVILGIRYFSKKYQCHFLTVTDFIVPIIPIGLGLGRVGNFINGELWGHITQVPWGIILSEEKQLARHPSQLYELFLEGIVLYVILNAMQKRSPKKGIISGYFLVLYGIFRFLIEFFREPDHHLGYFVGTAWLTMGHILSIPMVILGVYLLFCC